MSKLKGIQEKLAKLKLKKEVLVSQKEDYEEKLSKSTELLHSAEEARVIILQVAQETQEQLKYHISNITCLALEAVFPDPYELVLDFIQRRGKTECDIMFKSGENLMNPLSQSGGGAVEVASFALRIACWALQAQKSNNTIILDEPMRFVDATVKPLVGQMVKEISEKLGIQFIIVTHDEPYTDPADRVFRVVRPKKVSKVTVER